MPSMSWETQAASSPDVPWFGLSDPKPEAVSQKENGYMKRRG